MSENMYDVWDNGDRHEIRQQLAARNGMKEEWLFPGAVVPVTPETVVELINEIKRLIEVVGGMALAHEATLEKNNLTWVANCQHLVKAEREACAKLCEEPGWNAANWCAKQIRARGEEERVVEVCTDGTQTVEVFFPELLAHFAALVVAPLEAQIERTERMLDDQYRMGMEAEREACAKVCEKQYKFGLPHGEVYAKLIRARGEEK